MTSEEATALALGLSSSSSRRVPLSAGPGSLFRRRDGALRALQQGSCSLQLPHLLQLLHGGPTGDQHSLRALAAFWLVKIRKELSALVVALARFRELEHHVHVVVFKHARLPERVVYFSLEFSIFASTKAFFNVIELLIEHNHFGL